MTWVIGACPPLGAYGVLLSDVQVTLANGLRLDALRKVYDVGPCLALGFAGSVRLGFQMVDSLRAHLQLPPGSPPNAAWIPAYVAETWCSTASAVFAEADEAERNLGCALLLVGVHPVEDVMPGRARAYVIRLASPGFRPGYSPRRLASVLSIGTGRRVPAYRRAVRELFRMESGIFQAEVGHTGGWGQAISFSVGKVLEWHPEPGVSRHMHYAEIRRGAITIYNNNRTDYPPDGEPILFRMPKVASSYAEFCELVRERGFSGASALC